ALVEYLKSSRIKIIGSTTPEAFQRYIYQKQEIKELFDVIDVNEPDSNTALYMMLEKAFELEKSNSISISFSAVKEARDLSDSYTIDGSAMPGRAIRLLDDVISYGKTHGHKKISKKEVQDFIQQKTHIVLDKPSEEESRKLLNLESELHKQIISQDEAVVAIADAMRRVRSGMKDQKKPIASFLFLGPTGVGKTETAKALASSYFGDEKDMIRMDMSEYQNPDSIERFLGNKGGPYAESLADKILKNPFTLILLDEFEKAYPPILDLFLQILDEGHLTDNLGRTVSFNNSIIIATSNAGSEFIREEYKEGVNPEEVKKQLIEKVLQVNVFKPELINRFDDVIVFRALSEKDVVAVAKLFLQDVINVISEKQISLSYDPEVAEFIAKHAYSVEFGARNIKRFIEQSVENRLSKMILSNELPGGSQASINVEGESLVIKH
ncbi:MAG: AAA family ATPase, partial [Candidatus Levybacteria bacterium]|nr:AAA family ATPase [Candidatus Levybacteria bacterium]